MGAEAGGLNEDAAIRALGPLFRLTEVFLWDDASGGISKSSTCHDSLPKEDSVSYVSSAVSCSYIDSITDDAASAEDLELAKQMDALGLPTSFKTNKEKRNISSGEKKKGALKKSTFVHKVTGVQVPGVSRLVEAIDRTSSQGCDGRGAMSPSCIVIRGENDTPNFDAEGTFNKAVLHSDSELKNQDVVILEKLVKEQPCTNPVDVVATDSASCDCDLSRVNVKQDAESIIDPVDCRFTSFQENAVENIDHLCYHDTRLSCEQGGDKNILEDAVSLCCVTESVETVTDSNTSKCLSNQSRFDNNGEWGIFWDAFYVRNYYYNFHTRESTWYPPPGLEQSTFSFILSDINADVAEKGTNLTFAWDDSNYQGVLKATTPSQEVQNDRNVPTDVVDEGTCRAFAWDDNDNQDAWKVTNPSQEVRSSREVSGQASEEVMPRVDYATENLISDMDLSFLSGSSKLDERVEQINCSETSASAKDFSAIPFCPTDAVNHANRLTSAPNDTGAEENWSCVSQQVDTVSMSNELDSHLHVLNRNRKKKVKRIKSTQKALCGGNEDHSLPGTIEGLPASLVKYWYQRYFLFSKFDYGVRVDEEGWFSITPEAIARHHASRCGHGTVIDCFTGVGGNAIQFAMKSNHVIAIDIDPQKVDYAQHNAMIYGVGSNIDFIKGDFFHLTSQLKADTAFMSPPWGGPDYAKVQTYDIRSMLKPHDGYFLFNTAIKIASTVVMFLPRNVDPNQLAELSLLAHPPWELEVERNYLNGKLKGITAYFFHPSNKSK